MDDVPQVGYYLTPTSSHSHTNARTHAHTHTSSTQYNDFSGPVRVGSFEKLPGFHLSALPLSQTNIESTSHTVFFSLPFFFSHPTFQLGCLRTPIIPWREPFNNPSWSKLHLDYVNVDPQLHVKSLLLRALSAEKCSARPVEAQSEHLLFHVTFFS